MVKKPTNEGNRHSAVALIAKSINDSMNMGTVAFDYGNENPLAVKYWFSTGIPTLDICLRGKHLDPERGNGGVPAGRIARIDGQSGGGKSLIAWNIANDAVQKGGIAMYFDIEKAITEEFAEKLNIEKSGVILFPHLTTLEKVFQAAYLGLVAVSKQSPPERPPFGVICIDSVQAMMTEDQIAEEESIGGSNFGRKAKLMGEMLQKILPYLDSLNFTLVLTNQLRANVNKKTKYEDDWIVPTQNAQEFYAQQIIRVYKSTSLKDDKQVIGQVLRVVTKKSRYTAHGKEIKVDLLFDSGLQNEASILDALKAVGAVSSAGSKGSKIVVNGNEVCFKKDEFKELYQSNQEIRDWAIARIEETYKSGNSWHQIDIDVLKQEEVIMEDEKHNDDLRRIREALHESEKE